MSKHIRIFSVVALVLANKACNTFALKIFIVILNNWLWVDWCLFYLQDIHENIYLHRTFREQILLYQENILIEILKNEEKERLTTKKKKELKNAKISNLQFPLFRKYLTWENSTTGGWYLHLKKKLSAVRYGGQLNSKISDFFYLFHSTKTCYIRLP